MLIDTVQQLSDALRAEGYDTADMGEGIVAVSGGRFVSLSSRGDLLLAIDFPPKDWLEIETFQELLQAFRMG